MNDRKKKQQKKVTRRYSTLKMSDRVEYVKYSYDLVNMWIGNADNKVSVACALLSGIFAFITLLSEQITPGEEINTCWERAYMITFILSIIVMLISVFYYMMALSPNLLSFTGKEATNKTRKKFPLYFGDIKNSEFSYYKGRMYASTEKDLLDEMITETYYNAGVCAKKMKRYKKGQWISLVAILLSSFSLAAHYLMYQIV